MGGSGLGGSGLGDVGRSGPRFRTALLLGALAATCAARVMVASPGAPPTQIPPAGQHLAGRASPGPATTVGVARSVRAAPASGDGTEAWALTGQRGLVVVPTGSLAAGDAVAVAPTARRAARARSTHRPLAPRTSSLRPRADELVRVPAARGGRAQDAADPGWVSRLRRGWVRACLEHPDPNCAGLLAALLLGDRSGLPPEVVDRFTRTGTRHLLALSGFHVGLLAVLVVLPLARAAAALATLVLGLAGSRRRPDGGPLAAAAVLLFVPLSGGGAPATRAAVGLALALLAGPLGRRPSASNLLGVAALVELAVDPLAPLRPGTQLSYLATGALVTLAAPVHRALCGDPAARPWLAATGPTGWPRPALLVAAVERARRLLLAALAAGAVASLATLPVAWCVFGEWSPASLLATPVATPPVAVLMVSGWARILAPGETADAVALLASESLLRWLALVDSLPWTPLPLPERPALALAALTAALLAAARSPARRRRLGSAAALGFGLLLAPWPGPSLGPALGPSSVPPAGTQPAAALPAGVAPGPTPRGLEVHVLDVGNGTAVVVRAPGDPAWVLDAGSRDRLAVASEGVGALLRALDVGAVRAAASHDHADHAGALPWILDRWGSPPPARPHASAPSRVDHPRSTARSAPHRGADARAGRRARTSPWRPHPSGVTWLHGTRASTRGTTSRGTSTWGASTGGLAIAAVASGLPDPNEGSATFDVRWRGAGGREVRALLCGDAEGAGLRRMLEGGDGTPWIEPGPVDLLLMPHHGSETRHLAALLDRTRPALAVVSGEVPGYAAELARRGIPLHVTGRDGPLLWTPAGAAPSPSPGDGNRGAAGAPEERRGPR